MSFALFGLCTLLPITASAEIEGEIHRVLHTRDLYFIQDEAQESLPMKWTTGINLIYDDGIVRRAERKEVFRFLRSLPRGPRVRYLMSWIRLQKKVGVNTNPAVVSGIVASWAISDPAAAAGWLNSQTPRP